MNNSFYTNVQVFGNNILYRGIVDGKRRKQKIPYSPSLYLPSNKESTYKNLQGEYLSKKSFETIREAKDYIKQFENVHNSKIYGNNRFEYAFIADYHKGMIDYDFDKISIAVIDIEVASENGFPHPHISNDQITAIGIKYIGGDMFVFGCGDYETKGKEIYVKCQDEFELCKKFLSLWQDKCPDIVTGWNSKLFDIPYIVNRFRKVLGEEETKKLSPWNYINDKLVSYKNQKITLYNIMGVSSLDYMELYISLIKESRENYRLETISQIELGEGKLSYDDYDNIHSLYKLNHQLFIEYNIKDVELIVKLEEKLKLLETGVTLAYDTKSNYEDIFTQTRMWDSLTYAYLLEKNIIVPPKEIKQKSASFEGAYVKKVQVGIHHYVASYDLTSLYPHIMMQYNISPETLIQPENYTQAMRDIIASGVSVEKILNKEIDFSKLKDAVMTPNGQFFRTDVKGFLPSMMEEMFRDRSKFKKLMLKAKQEYENEKDEQKKIEIAKVISKYDNLQTAKKLSLNSAYGALGSQYFRFYDLRLAMAVTLAGQLSIRWIANKINEYMNNILSSENVDYIIASDTDSIYLRMGELINKFVKDTSDKQKVISVMDKICEEKIKPFIDKKYQELADYVGAPDQKMQMKREALADKGIWTAKKRYILNVYNNEGVQYSEPELKVMGLEMVKSSTPSVVKLKMKELIRLMIDGT